MMSIERLAFRRAVNKAKQLHADGDPEGARQELDAFIRRFPKSTQGWRSLVWAVGAAGGTIEERLDVHRRAAEAVPYDVALVDAAVTHLVRAAVMIGDRRYLEEATDAAARFEDVLGESTESILWRAALAQMKGDVPQTLALCEQAQALLDVHPDSSGRWKLGLCLSSVPGHEGRGLQMAEEAAAKLKDFVAYAYLAAIVRDDDPARAQRFISEARRLGGRRSLSQAHVDALVERASEDIRQQREFLKSV